MPCRGAWPHLEELESTFGKDGLRVLALSSESREEVEAYVEQMGIPVTVAAGSRAAGAYGIPGYPSAVLIDADGNLAWQGHPGGLSKGLVKKLIQGAKRPKIDLFAVRYDPEEEIDSDVGKARDLAHDGRLSDASREIQSILSDENSGETARKQAAELEKVIAAKVAALTKRAEAHLKIGDIDLGIEILKSISKEFDDSENGKTADARLAEIGTDERIQAELEAAKAFERLKKQIRPLKPAKAKPKIEEFAEKHAGTRAGDRASMMLRPIGQKKS